MRDIGSALLLYLPNAFGAISKKARRLFNPVSTSVCASILEVLTAF